MVIWGCVGEECGICLLMFSNENSWLCLGICCWQMTQQARSSLKFYNKNDLKPQRLMFIKGYPEKLEDSVA